MADNAAANSAHDAVMASVMAGDAANDRALEAALGLGGRGHADEGQSSVMAADRCDFM